MPKPKPQPVRIPPLLLAHLMRRRFVWTEVALDKLRAEIVRLNRKDGN